MREGTDDVSAIGFVSQKRGLGSWARFLAPFERLQGKQGLHNLPPEAGLVPAQPVDELVVEVGQSQVADGDVARRAPPTSAVTFWADLVSAVRIGGKLFARFRGR